MTRQCGDCQLCCKLLPVPPLGKKAGERCKHQKFGKGCGVYDTRQMPHECSLWNCRWLVEDDTAELSRPDRSHYVIDMMPDFVIMQDNNTGKDHNVEVVQVWIDPRYPQAHRDIALRQWMIRRGEEGKAILLRFNSKDATAIFPPSMTGGQWIEIADGTSTGRTHTPREVIEALGGGSLRHTEKAAP